MSSLFKRVWEFSTPPEEEQRNKGKLFFKMISTRIRPNDDVAPRPPPPPHPLPTVLSHFLHDTEGCLRFTKAMTRNSIHSTTEDSGTDSLAIMEVALRELVRDARAIEEERDALRLQLQQLQQAQPLLVRKVSWASSRSSQDASSVSMPSSSSSSSHAPPGNLPVPSNFPSGEMNPPSSHYNLRRNLSKSPLKTLRPSSASSSLTPAFEGGLCMAEPSSSKQASASKRKREEQEEDASPTKKPLLATYPAQCRMTRSMAGTISRGEEEMEGREEEEEGGDKKKKKKK